MCILVRLGVDLPICQPADIKPNPQLAKVFFANHYKTAACTNQVTTGGNGAWLTLPHSQRKCKHDWVSSAFKAPSSCLTLLGCRQQGAL